MTIAPVSCPHRSRVVLYIVIRVYNCCVLDMYVPESSSWRKIADEVKTSHDIPLLPLATANIINATNYAWYLWAHPSHPLRSPDLFKSFAFSASLLNNASSKHQFCQLGITQQQGHWNVTVHPLKLLRIIFSLSSSPAIIYNPYPS